MTTSPPPPLLIFEIPHIQDDICAYLTRESLAHCTAVSRLWSALFTSYLYRTIDLTHIKTIAHFKDRAATVSALVRYKDRVQTLKTSAMNKLMLALLRDDAIIAVYTAIAFADDVSSSSVTPSMLLLPKFMRETLDLWKFTNLRTFEWIVPKSAATVSLDYSSVALHQSDANYPLTNSNSNISNNDGSMTALQFVGLHIDLLESISLKFRTLTRHHVRILTGLLRGQRPKLRSLVVEYTRADVQRSVMKRLAWTALSLYKTKSVIDSRTSDGNGESRSHRQAALETFHLVWAQNGHYGWDNESDSDTENDDQHTNHSHDDHPSSPSTVRPRGQLRQSHVKNLSFSFDNGELELVLLRPLLQQCPDLESLSFWTFGRDSLLDQLPDLLRKFCPQFRSLGVGNILAEDAEISQLIAGCSQTTNYIDDEPSMTATAKVAGLQEFRILSHIGDFDEISALALGLYHGASLETLDFSKQIRFPAHLFLQLIKHCPGLRVLRCNIELRKEHQGQMIDYSALLSIQSNSTNSSNINNDWPFATTLKIMDLAVYRGSDLEMDSNYRHGDGSVSDQYIAYLYTQVARLTHLEEWRLGGWMMLLRLGWGLDKLSGLKALKVLDLREHTFIRLTEKEVAWIAEDWTALFEIWGLKSPNLQPIVQQLKTLRPTIQIL
ncbi:hypothetical protein BGZ47_007764 [Haplosporangium gracile]|nr:hypothetical protein BGZ47_007764 [Haplosporangium gracile]